MAKQPPESAAAAADDQALLRGFDGVDSAWYRKTYPDIGSEMDAVDHYARFGWREGRSPNQQFSTFWYLRTNPDVASAQVDPLMHFLREGREQGRASAPHETGKTLAQLDALGGVDNGWYCRTYRLPIGTNAAAHYAARGWREGKDPNSEFSTAWYLAVNRDIAAAGVNPFVHYLAHGRREGRKSRPSLLDTMRIKGWWWKLAPIAAAIYATAYQLNVSCASLTPLVLIAFAAVTVQAVYVSLINDLSDRSEDLVSGKRNGQFGRSATTVAAMLLCCIIPGAFFAFWWRHDTLLVSVYLAGWIAFSAYSLWPIRLKGRGLWGVIADASGAHLFPTLFGVVLVYHWQAVPIDPAWLAAVGVWSFCYGSRGILWHQLVDRDKDEAAGVRTFVQSQTAGALRRLTHGIIFPCEIAALACMFWIVGSLFAVVLAALYLVMKWWRSWRFEPPLILTPRAGQATVQLEPRLTLFSYYEFLLPLTFLLVSSLRYPADLLILFIHALVLSPRAFLSHMASRLASFTVSLPVKPPRLRTVRH